MEVGMQMGVGEEPRQGGWNMGRRDGGRRGVLGRSGEFQVGLEAGVSLFLHSFDAASHTHHHDDHDHCHRCCRHQLHLPLDPPSPAPAASIPNQSPHFTLFPF